MGGQKCWSPSYFAINILGELKNLLTELDLFKISYFILLNSERTLSVYGHRTIHTTCITVKLL